jgi:hypothetical protein
MGCLAVQAAVGEIGSKATTEATFSFLGLVNCGRFQYGLNENGIYRLNSGDTDAGARFTKTITLATSDFGSNVMKRFRYLYVELETEVNIDIIIGVKPNKDEWLEKTVSVTGPGLQTVRVSINREDGQGNFHSVRLSSTGWFRLHSVRGLINDRRASIRRKG